MSTLGQKTAKNIKLITKPRITEKATALADDTKHPTYVFTVDRRSSKTEIKKAVKEKYGVAPVKVNIINLPAKQVLVRGKFGTKPGQKKAVVFLKAGEKLEN